MRLRRRADYPQAAKRLKTIRSVPAGRTTETKRRRRRCCGCSSVLIVGSEKAAWKQAQQTVRDASTERNAGGYTDAVFPL